MKIILLFLLTALNTGCAVSQIAYQKEISNLSKVKMMPYVPELSGDDFFWDAVKCKLDIVPFLIEILDDDRMTKANVNYFGGNYALGDISFYVITEIIRDVPTLELIKEWKNFDESRSYGNYWSYVRESKGNRATFKKKVKEWYKANKQNLVWIEDNELYLKEDKEGAQRFPHPAGGYYRVKQ